MTDTSSGGPPNYERRGLPIGARVAEFEILSVIGGGGFGLVYLARDTSLGRRVAVKEFMPLMASRAAGSSQVTVHFLPDVEAFQEGLARFLNEARHLARFDHPALVKVHRVWEENGTAYMAMPYYDGPTLQKAVAENTLPEDEASMRHMLSSLLDALATMHMEQCYHRDISPDNIILTPNGPVLLDFGAARSVVGSGAQNFTVVLKQGYAPLEQYATEGTLSMRQGPWTDIYALCGVMRYIITGCKPASAVARAARRPDPQEPLARIARGRYSDSFLRTLDAGMALYVEDRPQSITEFRQRLLSARSATEATGAAALPQGRAVPAQLSALRRSMSVAMAGPWPRRLAIAGAPFLIVLGAAAALALHETHGPAVPAHAVLGPTLVDNDDGGGGDALEMGPPAPAKKPPDGTADRQSSETSPPKSKSQASAQSSFYVHPSASPKRERALPPPPPHLPPPAVALTVIDPKAIKAVNPPQPDSPAVVAEGDANRLGDNSQGVSDGERDTQQTAAEILYAAAVDKVIKAHSVVPDTPEYSAALMKSRGRETVVSFELDRDGRVSQVFVDRPSGSLALDKLAERIVAHLQYPAFPQDAWAHKPNHVFTVALKFQN